MTQVPRCILPVLDLMGGCAVHALAGDRSQYLPLVSRWTTSAHDPVLLTATLREQLGLNEYYVADLDALELRGSNQQLIQELVRRGFQLWLDAGMTSVHDAALWLERGLHRFIVSSESLPSLAMLSELIRKVDVTRVVFSLDLHAGKIRSRPGVFDSTEPFHIIDTVIQMGIGQLVILDTSSVGTAQGPVTLPLCEWVRKRHPGIKLISGGGVRHRGDIELIQKSGVDRVLVSTWLHAMPTTISEESIDRLVP